MNLDDIEREIRLQAAAEEQERHGGRDHRNPEAMPYQLIHRAVRTASIPDPPPDFAAHVAQLSRDSAEQAAPEAWCVRIGLALIPALAILVGPSLRDAVAALAESLNALPWTMLMMAGASIVALAAADKFVSRRWSAERM